MTYDNLDRQIERILKRNQLVIQRAEQRSERFTRVAARLDPALERALATLRQSVR